MARKAPPASKAVKKPIEKRTSAAMKPRHGVNVEHQTKIQKALYEIADAASAVTDMQSFYRKLHMIVGKLMYAKNFFIALYDEQADLITWPYYVDTVDIEPPAPVRLKDQHGGTAWILKYGKTLAHIDGSVDTALERGEAEQIGTVSDAIGVPLKSEGKTKGVLLVQSYKNENIYSMQDLEVLTFVGQHIAIAWTRARAIEETRQRNAELQIINSVQEGLASRLDTQEIYNLVGDKMREIFDAQGMTIATYDPAANLLYYRYSIQEGERIDYDPTPLTDRGFRAQIIRTHRSLRLDDVERQGADYGSFKLQPANAPLTSKPDAPKSWLGVPLLVGNEVRGVVNLYNVDRSHAFTDADLRLLETLTNSMSVALENARLWEQEKMYRKALERELEIGREIQAGFLPELLPLAEGWEIAASLRSAREVAGDFYDAFELPEGNIGLVIADVCDKGVGAALFMTLFRSLIRAAANLEYFQHIQTANVSHTASARLERALSLTNNYIAETHGESGMFATIFFGILDPRDGKLTYVNGGHEPPLIVEAGAVCESLRKTGPAVGAITDCQFGVLETRLQNGQTLLAFTDGVQDSRNSQGDFFGRDRLLGILREHQGSAHELVKAIESNLHEYMDGTTQFDDITLLAVKRVH